MRAHVLAQEKYREIRGELTHSPINRYAVRKSPEKNGVGIGVPCFQGAHRLNHVSSGFFVRRHGSTYGRAVQGTFGCAVILGRGTPTCTVLPTLIGVGRQGSKTCPRSQS